MISLFLEGWEVERWIKLPLASDLLCQEMRDACWESSEPLGSLRSLCSECQEGRKRSSEA